jgi:4-hydroxybenzoate polyprenyltransferase
MFCLQAGIGTANDLLDADADAVLKPRKPIPLGLIGEPTAERVLAASLALGLGLSALSGPATFAIAAFGTAVGLAYDLRLKGTAWSWLPFAVGIPLLPLYGWVGASGGPVPSTLLVLVGLAVPAGAGLAIANALGDLERDRAAGRASVATSLGRDRAWRVGAILQVVVLGGAVAMILGARPSAALLVVGGAAAGLVLGGLILGRGGDASTRELGWEAQAVGLAGLAVVWLLVLPGAAT